MGLAPLEGFAVKRFAWAMRLAMAAVFATAPASGEQENERGGRAVDLLVIIGAPGEAGYGPRFAAAAAAWKNAATLAGASCTIIGAPQDTSDAGTTEDRDGVRQWLQQGDREAGAALWIVYIGHGTWDGREARLNLRGADLSASELGQWLEGESRRLVFVHGGSAAAPFIPALSAPNRVLITGTASGDEVNYARFGEFFALAVANPTADIDQDGQTSLLEAFLYASRQVTDFYQEDARMETEHALLDDNGDRRGTPADWFRGTRAVRRAEDGTAPDGSAARGIALVETVDERSLSPAARARRDVLEQELEALRARRLELTDRDYQIALEGILRELGAIYLHGGDT